MNRGLLPRLIETKIGISRISNSPLDEEKFRKENHPFILGHFQVTSNMAFISLSRLGIPDAVHLLQSGMGGSKSMKDTGTVLKSQQ